MAESIATLVSAGLSVEDAVKAVTLLGGAKTATTKTQPKAEKATAKAAQPKAESKATTKAQPKAESKAKAQPKAEKATTKAEKATTKAEKATVKADADHGKALMANCKFVIEQTVRTDDPTVTVWRVSLAERVAKSDWADMKAYFGREFDAGYWRGAWTFPFNPTKVLAGGKLTAKQSEAIADRKAARAAAREARKAARKGA
jgi:chemotaxis protein histidine kinase CheA